jgi:hypothetical protein
MVHTKACKLCGQGFEVERKPGRPREHCYKCVPAGRKAAYKRGRLKPRRITPVGPRIPKAGWATITQIGA